MAHLVRPAVSSDLQHLPAIEAAADALFTDFFGNPGWDEPVSGESRRDDPGFLLIAVPEHEPDLPVGFVHVIDLDGHAHLEQLSVHPDSARQGIGSMLVRAALAEASARGHQQLTLTTFADVPWNAPFYRRLGFTYLADDDLPAPLQVLRDRDRDIEIINGRRWPRIAMIAGM